MVYDKAKWHFDGDFPADLPASQGAIHIRLYLGWIVDSRLSSPWFAEHFSEQIQQFKAREILPSQLYANSDGVLADDMLNEEGNAFSEYYYGRYLEDYFDVLASDLPSMYHVKGSWEDYDQLQEELDGNYDSWKSRQRSEEDND